MGEMGIMGTNGNGWEWMGGVGTHPLQGGGWGC